MHPLATISRDLGILENISSNTEEEENINTVVELMAIKKKINQNF